MTSVGYVWVGDPDRGRKLLATLRNGTSPGAERVQELSYLQLQRLEDEQQRPWQRLSTSTTTSDPRSAFRWARSLGE